MYIQTYKVCAFREASECDHRPPGEGSVSIYVRHYYCA